MPQTRPTKVTVPVNSDAYNLAGDLATMADSIKVTIPVASQAERDGLAAQFPGGVLPNPTYVARNDLTDSPVEQWNGTAWRRVTEESVAWASMGAWTTPDGYISRRWNGSKWLVRCIGHFVLSTNSPFTLATGLSAIGSPVPAGWKPAPANAYGIGAYSNNTPTYQGPIIAQIDTNGQLSIATMSGTLNVVQNCQIYIDVSWTY